MIPILYEGNVQNFNNNGLGRLSDAISCTVTEERNGQFELEMTYPMSGIHYGDIRENRIILAKTEDGGSPQAFIIYKISQPLNGVVTISAQHISYLLCGFVVMPFSGVSCADTFSKIANNIVIQTPFTFNTDVNSSVHFELTAPRSVRNLLGGESGSILDTYGGYDYKFDNFTVYLYTDRGYDNGVTLRYGKNLTALKNVFDTTNVYTAIVPYWADSEGNSLYLPERVVYSEHAADYPYTIIKTVDFSSDFESMPTEAQLRAKAESYIATKYGWKLKNSIDVSFVNLAQTEEYKDLVALERVRMCDTVTVIYEKLGVNIKTKVIKTVYNVLTEKYDSISLGDTTYTLAKAIQESLNTPTMAETTTAIQSAVQRATKLIQGGLGGHVVFNTDGNGEPQEILIMDTADINTAVNVIRMNLNGIGFSHNGYEGPFETAWTIDGHFVADFIDTGELNGSIIKAGTVSANVLSVEAKDALGQIHDFMPYDAWTNISRWKLPSGSGLTVAFETITVGGEQKTALKLDGTSLVAYDTNDRCWFYSDVTGTQRIHYKFKFMFPSDTDDIIRQRFGGIAYYGTSGQFGIAALDYVSGEYTAGDVQTFDRYLTLSGSGACLAYGNTEIGFNFIPGEIVYVFDMEITGDQTEYNKASMTFDSNGLSSVVQSGSVISSINQTAESVSIKASKIDLTGALSLHGDFTCYNTSDNTDYAYLDDGRLSFYNNGSNVFTIASDALAGSFAGIFFGDWDDPTTAAKYTRVTQEIVRTPTLYVGEDATISPSSSTLFICDGQASIDELNIPSSNTQSNVRAPIQFYKAVKNSSGGTQFTSDRRKKRSIKDLAIDKARSFIMGLKPVKYKFLKDVSTSDRYHHGFIAQDVHEAMPEDWGIYCEDKEDDFIGLRYDEFIADMVAVIQDQQKRIEALEGALHDKSGI